jgi:hypothetical protein
MKINGGCHCGYITFEGVAEPNETSICHCTDCQKMSGSAFRVSVPVSGASLKMLGAEPAAYVKTAESGNKRIQAFCPKCGSAIYSTSPGDAPRPVYFIRVGTLEQRDRFVPQTQIWFRSAQPWTMGMAALPKNEKGAR